MAINAAPTCASLKQDQLKIERKVDILLNRFNVLSNRFCSYWLDEKKAPAFGIMLQQYEQKGRKLADIYIISEHLSRADIVMRKEMIDEDPKVSRVGRFEPLVLDQDMFAELMEPQDLLASKEPSDDGNSALS